MIASNNNFVCVDNQIPSSSNAYTCGAMYPNSNQTVLTPDSNYAPSPQPHSRTMTPNQQYPQPMYKQENTNVWMQNYHERSSYGNPSPAPSVMSAVTQLSGLTNISVNTQATNVSQMSNFNNNFQIPHGPLSSNSHSENVDPKQDLCAHAESCLLSLSDSDEEVRAKAASILNTVVKRLKGARNVSTLIEKILKSVIDALHRERPECEGIQLSLCFIIGDVSHYFMNIFIKIILIEKNSPNGIMRKMLSFYDRVENIPLNLPLPRFLRYLFPSLYPLFLDDQSAPYCIKIAKDSKLGIFLMRTIQETFVKATEDKRAQMDPNYYFQTMKFAANYINILRILVVRNEPLRLKLFNLGIIQLLLNITRRHFHHFEPSAAIIIRCHSAIIKTLENLLRSAHKNLPDELVKNQAVQVLLTASHVFKQHNATSLSTEIRLYTCLANFSDSKEMLNIDPQIAPNFNIATVINEDLKIAYANKQLDFIAAIASFGCNASRGEKFKIGLINVRHQDIVLECINAYLLQAANPKYQEVLDNFLFILQNLCYVESQQHQVILSIMENPQVMTLLVKTLETNHSIFILRVLRIWRRTARLYPQALTSVDSVSILLAIIRTYWQKSPLISVDIDILKISIQILQMLASKTQFNRAFVTSINPSELIGFLNHQENIELISALLVLIYDLWQHCFELRDNGLSSADMSSLLQRFVDLKSSELSKQAKMMLSYIETHELNSPLASAFINYST